MSPKKRIVVRLSFLVVAGVVAALVAMQPAPAAGPVATFEAHEVLGREWSKSLVTYPVELRAGQAFPDKLRLVDAAGDEQPCQASQVRRHGDGSIAAARISFMAALPKYGNYTYRLLPERPAAAPPPRAADQDPYLTLENELVALRLPRTGERRPATPLRFGNHHENMVAQYGKQDAAGLIPGPIQGVRLADGRWVGGSYFWSADPGHSPRVTSYRVDLTEQGPLFVEAKARYEFDNGGFYELTARVLAGDPAVRIDERLDLKTTGRGDQWRLIVSLSKAWEKDGWKPDAAFWISPARSQPRDEALEQALQQAAPGNAPAHGGGEGSAALQFDLPARKVFGVEVWYPWNPAAHYFTLVQRSGLAGAEASRCPSLSVVPLHAGSWRGNQFGFTTNGLYTHKAGDVALHWPLVADPHPNSLMHTGEYDPAQPLTYRRRVWALTGGLVPSRRALFDFRDQQGNVGLDRYKDWVVDWPADPAVTYPRLVMSGAKLREQLAKVANLPAAEALQQRLYVKDNAARREELFKSLTSTANPWAAPREEALEYFTRIETLPWHSNYRFAQMTIWCHEMDELLSSPALDPDRRKLLRAHVATLCYLLSDPDFNPRGSLVHLGNPNMPVNRFFGLTFAAALIPDHPRAKEWLDASEAYVRYKLAMNTAPGGAWSELLSYLMPSMHAVQAALVLDQAGRLSPATADLAAMPARFTLQTVTPPDPRFGSRALPNWGHEGCGLMSHWLPTAALVRERDPALAKALVWAWDQLGRPMWDHHDCGFSNAALVHADLLGQLPPSYVPPQLQSVWLPGFGAVLRAHAGDPQETYLAYRQGYLVSHCDANQGDFVLYAKGAPLSTLSLFTYATHNDEPFAKLYKEFGWHNRVRFGSQSNDGGWPGGGPISQVHAHHFDDAVDYLRGLGDYGSERWTRQILFLKGQTAAGPNYFVFRDSFHLREPSKQATSKWWYLRTPGAKSQVAATAAGFRYTSPHGPVLDAHFLQPAAVAVSSRDASQQGPLYGQAAINWKRLHPPAGMSGPALAEHLKSVTATASETMTVSAAGPVAPGNDILVVLYPRAAAEQPPRYEALGDGAARITTAEGTDYVFLARQPMKFQQGDVEFEGLAGAVRVRANEVHLCLAEGPGRVGYRGTVLAAAVPATRIVSLDKLNRPRTLDVPAPKTALTFALDPARGPIEELAPGVRRQKQEHGYAVEFRSEQPLTIAKDGLVFQGKHGGLVVDTAAGTTRLVLLDGEKIGTDKVEASGCAGPYDLTFHADRLTGSADGLGRFLYITRPAGLDRLPVFVLNGQTYAAGTYGNQLLLPLLPGKCQFELKALEQPPVFPAP